MAANQTSELWNCSARCARLKIFRIEGYTRRGRRDRSGSRDLRVHEAVNCGNHGPARAGAAIIQKSECVRNPRPCVYDLSAPEDSPSDFIAAMIAAWTFLSCTVTAAVSDNRRCRVS